MANKARKKAKAPKKRAARTTPKKKGRATLPRAADLFDKDDAKDAAPEAPAKSSTRTTENYTAKDIEVLEGLEPVRRRPGMYIGGTDERALHHLAAEALDNAVDEAVAGHANWVEFTLGADNSLTVRDNGRGIPVDKHPKIKTKSALEVIMTTLHSGGKFGGSAYKISGGLHGVGISVVNALSEWLIVEVARDRALWRQEYSRGKATSKLKNAGSVQNRRGTTISFHPDPDIFGKAAVFKPDRLYRMARSKAYLIRGVEIRWSCDKSLLIKGVDAPEKETLSFPGGLKDYLAENLGKRPCYTPEPFSGESEINGGGKLEWAIAWPGDEDGFTSSYVNTVPTPQGGSHETGLRTALTKGLRAYGELAGNKRAAQITAEDVADGACALLSLFIHDPQFQGQTKERLGMPAAQRLVEVALRDHFDHWLSGDPQSAKALLDRVIERADDRQRRRQERETARKSAVRRLRLPGKLADCARGGVVEAEIFLVEGDSAGGSAKQARRRQTQAVLPLRGKILNVASASADKLRTNQELHDIVQALGCGTGSDYSEDGLRYERVIIMTDADVDGAHIASLLLTFFYLEMRPLIINGHLFLAMPPLYRVSQGAKVAYAKDDTHKNQLLKKTFTGKGKVEISRFKGLGEMPPAQLRETTMNPDSRTLLRVVIPDPKNPEEVDEARDTANLVESLMGKKPELRFRYIQENARFVERIDV